ISAAGVCVDRFRLRVDAPHAPTRDLGDEDVARGIDGDAEWAVQLTGGERVDDVGGEVDLAYAIAVECRLGDVKKTAIDGQAGRTREDRGRRRAAVADAGGRRSA